MEGFFGFRLSHFLNAMKDRLHNDGVRVQAVDAWTQNQITSNPANVAIPQSPCRVQHKPRAKLEEMWSRQAWYPPPNNSPVRRILCSSGRIQSEDFASSILRR